MWMTIFQHPEAHGYANVSQQVVPAKDHTPLADEVLAFFTSLLAR